MFTPEAPDPIPVDRMWRCHQIEAGSQVNGWKIGPLVTVTVHWSGMASKPCHDKITGGKLPCRCATEKIASRKIGYLPLFTSSRERVVVILSNTVALRVHPLPQGSPLKLARTLVPCAPLLYSVWPSFECSTQQTAACAKWVPCDIQPWLLHLWQDETLSGYFAGVRAATVHAPTLPPPAPIPTSVVDTPPPARDNALSLSLIDPRRKRASKKPA